MKTNENKLPQIKNSISKQSSGNGNITSNIETATELVCFLCSSPGLPLYSNLVDHLFGAEGKWSLLECAECGLVWINPRPTPDEINNFYDNYHTHKNSDAPSWFWQSLDRFILAAVMGYRNSVNNPRELAWGRIISLIRPLRDIGCRSVMWVPARIRGKLLDVGCGAGAFLNRMQRLGWEVSGVEADTKAARIAQSVLKSNDIHVGQVEDSGFKEKSFDVITMSHVIEHLLEPIKTLTACHRILKPGGLLVITTPNSNSLGRRRFKELWRGWEPPRHIHIFNPRTLASIAIKAGYRVKSIKTPNGGGYIVWLLSLRLKKKVLFPDSDTPAVTMMMKIQSAFFWGLEDMLSRIGIHCGEEALLIAERPFHDGED